MNMRVRQIIKWSFRTAELGVAFALLAVLIELVLVILNTPEEFANIHLFRQRRPAVTDQVPAPPTQFPGAIVSQPVKPADKPKAINPQPNPVPPAPAAAPAAPGAGPALLSFQQTRRLASRIFSSDPAPATAPGSTTPATIVMVPVVSSSTVVLSTNQTGSGGSPGNGQTNNNHNANTNQNSGTASNTSTNTSGSSTTGNTNQVARVDPAQNASGSFRFALP